MRIAVLYDVHVYSHVTFYPWRHMHMCTIFFRQTSGTLYMYIVQEQSILTCLFPLPPPPPPPPSSRGVRPRGMWRWPRLPPQPPQLRPPPVPLLTAQQQPAGNLLCVLFHAGRRRSHDTRLTKVARPHRVPAAGVFSSAGSNSRSVGGSSQLYRQARRFEQLVVH